MKSYIYKCFLSLILISLAFVSCKDNANEVVRKPISKGSICEVVILAPQNWYQGEFKTTLEEVIEYEQYGLPQPENTFDLTFVPLENLSSRFNEDKTLLKIVPYQGEPYFTYTLDSMAIPQVIMQIGAPNAQAALSEFVKQKNTIRALVRDINIKKVEAENRMYGIIDFKKNPLSSYKISIDIPISFKQAVLEKNVSDRNFTWYRSETNSVSNDIWLAVLPYRPIHSEETFRTIRDSIVGHNIPGEFEGTKMQTHTKYFPPIFQEYKQNGYSMGELRGQWEYDKEFKGGPFDAIYIQDSINNRTIIAEGFVYAPGQRKRNPLFKLEAIIRSIKVQ